MNAREYYLSVQAAIHAAPHVVRSEMRFEEIDVAECYIRGTLYLLGDLELHIAEYVLTEPTIRRVKYRYHLQTAADKVLVRRWDKVAHHPQIDTLPHHRHDRTDEVHAAPTMDILQLLDAVLAFMPADG